MLRLTALLTATATPVFAAGGGISLTNSDFVVTIAFLLFIGVLVYFKVPAMLNGMLDNRAENIRKELDEAKALREEAQTVLAEFERKQKDVAEQADRIVAQAKEEAELAAVQAKADLEAAIARRLQTAEEQIASAEAQAVREVKDRAVSVAVAAAGQILAQQTDAARGAALIDESIETVGAKLH